MSAVTIRPVTTADATAVLAIHQAGMDACNASFEHTAASWAAFDAGKLPDQRLVAVDEHDTALGWVAVSRASPRAAYAFAGSSMSLQRRLGENKPGLAVT